MNTKDKTKKQSNKQKVGASSTAAWMSGCRGNRVAQGGAYCQDVYADLWLNDASRKKYQLYIDNVSETENDTLALRFQFFYKELKKFMKDNPDGVFINIGSGFSSYPYLLPKKGKYIEVDCHEVIIEKKATATRLQKTGKLPERNVIYIECNLDRESEVAKLFNKLKRQIGNRKSFLLFEGLLYYLKSDSVNRLFKIADKIQSPGSKIGTASWPMDTFNRPVYKRFNKFLSDAAGKPMSYVCHDFKYFKNIKGYFLTEHNILEELSQLYKIPNPLTKDIDYFEEDYCILEKK